MIGSNVTKSLNDPKRETQYRKVHLFGLPRKKTGVKKGIVGKELHCVTFIFNLLIVISRMVEHHSK